MLKACNTKHEFGLKFAIFQPLILAHLYSYSQNINTDVSIPLKGKLLKTREGGPTAWILNASPWGPRGRQGTR